MTFPFILFDGSTKVREILNDSLELERKRRQLAIEVSQLIKRVMELKQSDDRSLISGWLHQLMEDLR
jgi:hypothetical protein